MITQPEMAWTKLKLPGLSSRMNSELTAVVAMVAAQVQPRARCGRVPLGPSSSTAPIRKVAIAAPRWSLIWGEAAARGAKSGARRPPAVATRPVLTARARLIARAWRLAAGLAGVGTGRLRVEGTPPSCPPGRGHAAAPA